MTDTGPGRIQKGRCPVCGRPPEERYRPFCSKRCADVDLGRWLGGVYRVETEDAPDNGDGTPAGTGKQPLDEG